MRIAQRNPSLANPDSAALLRHSAESIPESLRLSEFFLLERNDHDPDIAHLQPIVSLLAGILILIMPRLLNYIVAIFLIISGILGLGLIR